MQGFSPLSRDDWCARNPDAVDYYEPTGYRKIPLSTCQSGTEMDKSVNVSPCPGKEPDFARKHPGPSGVAIFFAVTIPFAIAAGVGWWVYRNWHAVKFGHIRLGDNGGSAFDSDRPWVRYPIMAVSAAVAVAGALPLVVSVLWRSAVSAADRWGLLGGAGGGGRGGWSRLGGGGGWSGGNRRFTTRDSFARGRGDYAVVDEDEGELLGEDSDEEA